MSLAPLEKRDTLSRDMEARQVGGGPPKLDDSPSGSDSVTDLGEPALLAAPPVDIDRGSLLAGRYQVEAIIGRGGSGVVLRAFDRVAKTPVALKILKGDLARDPRWLERFSRELRLARQIQHPNVCRVFDIAEADGHRFLTMELAGAGTLRDNLQPGVPLRPLPERLADARALVSGLAAIHAAGIVHRDIKPDNLIRMDDGRLVLSDFGLATNPSEAPIMTVLVGTPTYMAPEVVMGDPATPQSDVWALGVVLHEILFGRRPEWDLSRAGRSMRPPKTDKLSPPERALVSLCADCLQENSVLRLANAEAVARRFERAVGVKSVMGARTFNFRAPRWIVPALIVIGAIAASIARGGWWTLASASFSHGRSHGQVLQPSGALRDLTSVSPVVASFNEKIHCMSWLRQGRALRIVLGAPRRALDIDPSSGQQTPTSLPASTFAIGCPQRSEQGELLFERFDEEGRREIMLAASGNDVSRARPVTKGSDPLWLPNGTELVFNVDAAHAAVFSLPVMTSNLVVDEIPPLSFLVDKAIRDDGRALVLRYMDQSSQKYVVLHRLPSLAVVAEVALEAAAREIAYWGKDDGLVFMWDELGGSTLSELNIRSTTANRIGFIPNHRLNMPIGSPGRLAFKSAITRSEVWRLDGGGQRTVKLSTTGLNYNPDLSERGDLITEHIGSDGKVTIFLFRPGQSPQPVTSGAVDYTPEFLPDGRGWLYVDGETKAIRRCTQEDGCRTVHVAADFPFFPVAAPDEKRIAYVTKINRPRLVILESSGEERDLGPARADCPPRWSSPTRVWGLQGTDRSPMWTETDVVTGAKTGAQVDPGPVRDESHNCPFLRFPTAAHRPDVAAWSWEDSDVRILER
jgi:serine/threonine protein kinase